MISERRNEARHHRAKRSDADVERARQFREDGLSYREIGLALGVSMWTARDWADYRTR